MRGCFVAERRLWADSWQQAAAARGRGRGGQRSSNTFGRLVWVWCKESQGMCIFALEMACLPSKACTKLRSIWYMEPNPLQLFVLQQKGLRMMCRFTACHDLRCLQQRSVIVQLPSIANGVWGLHLHGSRPLTNASWEVCPWANLIWKLHQKFEVDMCVSILHLFTCYFN